MILLSVPHTGTRYTAKFLESLGISYRQYHSEPSMFEDLQWESGKAIVPMRDPALQWVSTHFRADLSNVRKTLNFCMTCWDLLGRLEPEFNVEYLRLDASDHQAELKKIALFCDTFLLADYGNTPVGNILKDPISYDLWDMHKTSKVEEALKPYREKYGY